jgi:glycosyltransferase involved in cell wall biosynthesis
VKRVAFTLIGGKQWTGGYNYLLNLISLLAKFGNGRITSVLFFGNDVDPDDAAPFSAMAGVQVVISPVMDRRRRMVSLGCSILDGVDGAAQRLFEQYRIDVVFENAQFFGRQLKIPAIAWIPDFQHRHLRHLFGFTDFWKREIGFRAQVSGGRTIMLSSEDARVDCHRFFPKTVGRTRVVRFSVPASLMNDRRKARKVADGYGLPDRFFFMPNQFWRHKNHVTVVDALSVLKKRGNEVVVVASGRQTDPRDPDHGRRLLARVAELDVGQLFRVLGMIPYDHVHALMCASQALLNPSLFEGWSTTVEEAKSQGVPMLLSDIRVHREQAQGLATFFPPTSVASLADVLVTQSVLSDEVREQRTLQAAKENQMGIKRYAQEFIALVEDVCECNRQGA